MHSSLDGATNLRERRRSEVSAHLTRSSRRLTAEHGLHGFTVEQVCEEVGISRRTFFNYFASKEDAIFGRSTHADGAELDELFVAGGTAAPALSASLVDDLAALLIARWERMDLTRENAAELFAAIEREPRLLHRLLDLTREQEFADIQLVERRERLEHGDLRASTLVHVMAAIVRSSAEDVLSRATGDPFREALRARLAAVRRLFP